MIQMDHGQNRGASKKIKQKTSTECKHGGIYKFFGNRGKLNFLGEIGGICNRPMHHWHRWDECPRGSSPLKTTWLAWTSSTRGSNCWASSLVMPIVAQVDGKFFQSIELFNPSHVLRDLLPPKVKRSYNLRPCGRP